MKYDIQNDFFYLKLPNNEIIKDEVNNMSFEEIIVPSRDLYSLSVRVFEAKKPRAVVKMTHGMEEHQSRYEEFATFLQENGYIVVTADMRGHGKSAPKLSHIADKDGHKLLMDDEESILNYIKQRYPNLPIIYFGHSMGTIIVRKFLQEHSQEYQKVVLSGYPNPQAIGGVGAALSACIRLFKGGAGYSKMLTNMVMGPFSKAVENAKTPIDWLSYNEENVKNYDRDPLCGEEFTIGSYNALFHLVGDINKAKLYKNVKAELPFYLISGEDDPCTGGEKGRNDSINVLKKAGFKNIEVKTLAHMRHEILNEIDKRDVYNLILEFIEK